MSLVESLLLILVLENFIFLIIAFVGGIWIIRILKDVKQVTENVENTTRDLKSIKNKVKNYIQSLFIGRG